MRLKSFTAHTMRDAMRMVREALGEDAIIVATREENQGKTIHVTAAIDEDLEFDRDYAQGAEAANTAPQGSKQQKDWLYGDMDSDSAGVVEDITETMLHHGTPDDVIEQMVSYVTVMGLDNTETALQEALRSLYHFQPLPRAKTRKPLMLVGPPGTGKTLATAKMAARGVMGGLSVAVITTDTVRAGGVEQLEAFTRILEIDLLTADTPKALKEALMSVRNADQIIIDTAGVNPFSKASIKTMALLTKLQDVEPILVLPAGCDADESGDIARIFAEMGVKLLLPSRVDAARRMGGLLSAAYLGNLAFTDMSNTPKVAEGISPLNAKLLARMLLPHASSSQATSPTKRYAGARGT